MYMCIYVCMCVRMYMCMHVWMCVCMYVFIYLHIFIYSFIHPFIYSVVYFRTDPLRLPKRVLHTVLSSNSCFNLQYRLVSSGSSSSCLRLLPPLLATFILLFIIPWIRWFRRQFLRKMWPIHLANFHFTLGLCTTFLSSWTLCNTSSFPTQLVYLISILLQHPIWRYTRQIYGNFYLSTNNFISE